MLRITVDAAHHVSALPRVPAEAVACLLLAHGAGAGMTHPFMTAIAEGLHQRQVATLRFQFPAMEQGRRRPDTPALAQATVRAAAAFAHAKMPRLPLFAGGKSFGGRMTSQAQAAEPMPGVTGLIFLGFPLHPAGRPSDDRALHLAAIEVPMLFVQGTRDALADWSLMEKTVGALGKRATLARIEGANHSFHVPARSGHAGGPVAAIDSAVAWILSMVAPALPDLR